MRRHWQIIILCFSFLVGIVLAANYLFVVQPIVYGVVVILSVMALLKVKSKLGYVLFMTIGLLLGIWRFDWHIQTRLPSALIYENQKVSVVGSISGEPRWDQYRNYVFYLSDAKINNQPVDGLVRVKTLSGFTREGQIVKSTGKLRAGLGKAETLMSFANIEILQPNQPVMIQIKELFLRGLNTTLPKDSAAFMSGILIGERSALPTNMQNVLITLGLSHIVAVSGYNLTILVGVLQKRFSKNWRWGGLVSSLWIILGFVIIAGASASILRAGIMSALFLIVNYYGKRLNLVVCMGLVATAMVAMQPQSILSDIGWQLSFLSLLGITVLAPKISQLLPSKPQLLNTILSVTLAAQLATAGLIVFKFGQLSLLAPLSNLLIMPFIPLLMLFGFIAALAGLLLPNSAYMIVGQPIHLVVNTVFDLLAYLSQLRFASIELRSPSIMVIVLYYTALISLVIFIRQSKNKSLSLSENHAKIAGIYQPNQSVEKGVSNVRAQ